MKFSGKISLLAAVALTMMGSQAFALDIALTSTGVTVGGAAGAGLAVSGTSLDLSATLSNAKDAVINASPDAVQVLKGREATDAFKSGKAAAEMLLKTEFDSDADAAVAILELAEAAARE